MKKSDVTRAQEYLKVYKRLMVAETAVSLLQKILNEIYLAPFKTNGTYFNASFALSAILKEPEHVFRSSSDLWSLKDGGFKWSDETYQKHLPKIFKHFKETGFLVKKGLGWQLNPLLREINDSKVTQDIKGL